MPNSFAMRMFSVFILTCTATPFGAIPAQLPRLPRNDYTAHWMEYYMAPWENWRHPGDFLARNLIDNDLGTQWCSREQAQPDVESQWIRLDFPRERRITEIRIFPADLTLKYENLGLPKKINRRDHYKTSNMATVFKGQKPPHVVNPEVL